MLRCYLCMILFLTGLCACSPTLLTEKDTGNTEERRSVYKCPDVGHRESLVQARFTFAFRGKQVFTPDVREGTFSRFEKETGFCAAIYDYNKGQLPKVCAEWIEHNLSLSMGMQYCLVQLDSGLITYVTVQSVILVPGERDKQFGVVLGEDANLENGHNEFAVKTDGLAFPLATIKPMPLRPQLVTAPEDLSAVRAMLQDHRFKGELVQAFRVYARYPQAPCTLIILQQGELKFMSLWTPDKARALIRTKYPFLKVVREGLVIEDGEMWDHGLANSTVHVLPDLDGDGGTELVVQASGCTHILLSIRCDRAGNISMSEVTTYYNGP